MNTRLLEVEGKHVDGHDEWSWTGECGERVTLVAPAGLSREAGTMVMRVYVEAGLQFAAMVKAG